MLLENISQFYRTLIPTPLWFGFCSNYYDTGAVFAIIVTAGYLMIKGAVILASGRELFKALCTFIRDKVRKLYLLRRSEEERGGGKEWRGYYFLSSADIWCTFKEG